jgi:hypothetical protein
MTRKKRILIILITSTSVILTALGIILYLLFSNSDEIAEEESPEIILGMKLGGNFHEQIRIAKKNGLRVEDGIFTYSLDKSSIYPNAYSKAIEAQIYPKYVFNGTDSILTSVETVFFTTDYGPFPRVIQNIKHFILPMNLDSIPVKDLLIMEKDNRIRVESYYYLFEEDADDLVKSLESKYGKLKKVNTLNDVISVGDDHTCNEVVKKGLHIEEFLWKTENLVIYGNCEPIELSKKNGFINDDYLYNNFTTFRVSYSLPSKKMDELWKKSKQHEWKMKKELQNKSL